MTKYRKIPNQAYGLSNPLQDIAPKPIIAQRAPATTDIGHEIGTTWINTTTNQAWTMTGTGGGAAVWSLSSPGASDVDTLTGDGGGAISPVAGNITLTGGTNITTVGTPGTITYNLDDAITLVTSITSPLYTAGAAADVQVTAPAGQDVVIQMGDAAGANKVSFQSSTPAEVFAIDSTGTLTMAGLTVTGVLTQTAGAVNIGMDNLGSAINIGGGNVIKALAIGGGAGAHTIAIGSAAAGAIALDTAAGFSIDGATASNLTVTGAADLTINSTAGGVDLASGEAAVDAISFDASDAAGGITMSAGTGGLNLGNQADCTTIGLGDFAPTANRAITIGGGTVITAATTDTIEIGPDGATTNANSIKTVNINTGGVTLGEVLTNVGTGVITSGTHTVSIQSGNAAAGTVATNVSTGTGTKTVNIGNADALTTLNIDAVTAINTDVNANCTICTGTSTGSVTIGSATAGAHLIQSSAAIDITAAAASTWGITGSLDVDATGALSINSSAAAINVGNDDVDQAVNVGTDGERTVTVGSTNGAAATVIQSGTEGITFTGTVQDMTANFVRETGDAITFRASPIAQSTLDTCVIPTGVAATTDLLVFENGMIMEQFIIGTQSILAPRMGAAALGLTVSCDLTTAEGKEYNFGAARTSSKHSFTIGTSPAFYMQLRFTCLDVSTLEPAYFGFRKTQANNAAYGNYTDFVAYGLNDGVSPGDCAISTRLNSGAQVDTDTNDAWVDGATHSLRINVSAAGVVTFLFDGAPPTATQAYTFDNGDVVHPFWTHLYNATVAAGDEIYWESMEIGFQA